MNLHPEDKQVYKQAVELAKQAAYYLGIRLDTVEPKKRPYADSAEGLCYYKEHKISITFRYKNRKSEGGKWWKTSLPWDVISTTVLHEVAHLVYQNHSKEFKNLESLLCQKFIEKE